jgi:hypothetical protein
VGKHQDLSFRYNVGAAALAFVLAAVGFFSGELYGLTTGFLFGAIFLFACAHSFHNLAHVKLAWPLALAEAPERGEWEVFRFATIAALSVSLFISAIGSTAIYVFELRHVLAISEGRHQARTLRNDQKDRMRREMTVDPNESYSLQVNSIGSCDECALFSDEIRAFVNTIPGWKANGGPLPWPTPELQHYGLWLLAADKDRHTPPVEKIDKAFADSGLPLQHSNEGVVVPGLFVILIARAQ